jgi:hypothetical protein
MKRIFNCLVLVFVVLSCSCVKIKQQPADATIALGEPVTFTVSATGIGALKYQWERSDNGGLNWSQISGATNASYTIDNVSLADINASFRCTVKDILNASKTYTVELTVALEKGVTLLAGACGNTGTDDGIGSAARFNLPFGMTTDGSDLYVADSVNHTIRKIVIATAEVSTFAGTSGVSGNSDGIGTAARFYNPSGLTTDGTNLYVTDSNNQLIRKIVISTRQVITIAGSGLNGSDDGITTAKFNYPHAITKVGANLYVADTFNNTIRKVIIATGEVSTFAGTAGPVGWSDGIGTAARFWSPFAITNYGSYLYVADTGNDIIRKIDIATREVSTIAGKVQVTGSSDGVGDDASFYYPEGIATDGTSLFVSDFINNTIRNIDIATNNVTTITGKPGYSGCNDGSLSDATFAWPGGIVYGGHSDGLDILYVADELGNTIRIIVK